MSDELPMETHSRLHPEGFFCDECWGTLAALQAELAVARAEIVRLSVLFDGECVLRPDFRHLKRIFDLGSQAAKERDAFRRRVEALEKWVIEYDENSVAHLVSVIRPDIRRPLEHGQIIEAALRGGKETQ